MAKSSLRPEIDLVLIPAMYNIMESEWIMKKSVSSFRKSDLQKEIAKYGRAVSDMGPPVSDSTDSVSYLLGKTSHSTGHYYDKRIPISFYGPGWIRKGEYSEIINQQHIVPTLAKILNIRKPNGVKTDALDEILNKTTRKPKIIVTIVIDQGGQQLYEAHPEAYKNIRKLRSESAYYKNAEIGHLDTHTAVGHAAIGTGAYPKENGVIGNTFFRMVKGKLGKNEIYATDEEKVDPSELLTETLADVLDSESANKSEIISQCYALRASIGMAGHGSSPIKGSSIQGDKDFIYWLSAEKSAWVTDNRFYKLPAITKEYSPFRIFKKEYPNGKRGLKVNTEKDALKNWSLIMATPAEAKHEAEMFRNIIRSEIIEKKKHEDDFTDLAYITIKATDAAGHYFGWESLEAEETFAEADRQVGETFEFLKKEFEDNFILILTADHGCAPLPEISGGNRYLIESFFEEINSLIPLRTGDENLIKFMTVGQISLNQEIMKKYNVTEEQIIQKILNIKVGNVPFFEKVIRRSDLL
ncbi:MAG: alkaline phosphatase family protein [Leptospira sp.]|nr:alkaline phosphatase family protein [Leptospira sp.]